MDAFKVIARKQIANENTIIVQTKNVIPNLTSKKGI